MLDDLLKAFSHKQSRSWRPKHGHHHQDNDFGAILGVLRTVAGNKAMLAGLVLSSLVVLAVGAWLLVSLVSTSGPILDFVNRNGVRGVVEAAQALAQKVWEGTGK